MIFISMKAYVETHYDRYQAYHFALELKKILS